MKSDYIYKKIKNCVDWKLPDMLCKNANGLKPLTMRIPHKCKVIFISQAPSNPASTKQILNNIRNTTFQQVLSLLNISEHKFNSYVYWTHYGKCYPGSKKGGDQWPTIYCANKYLQDELNICFEKGAKLVIGMAEPAAKYLYCTYVNESSVKSKTKYREIINEIYKKENVEWMFIKHTAQTAVKSSKDIEFMYKVLPQKVSEII